MRESSGCLAVGDINGDGRLDLITTSITNVEVLLGVGDGTFEDHGGYPSGLTPRANGVALADFNRDGRLDVAVAGASGVAVLLNTGCPAVVSEADAGAKDSGVKDSGVGDAGD